MNDPRKSSPPDPLMDGLKLDELMAVGLDLSEDAVENPLSFDGFDIVTRIGRGGMGEVYLARQRDLDRDVVIKIISPELAKNPEFLERFHREARLMASLRHPHIVTIHQLATTTDDDTAIVMEYLDGGNLRDLLQAHPDGLPQAQSIKVIREIASALAAAHRLGLVHRDVKPENILLNSQGSVQVTDFGLALQVADTSARLTLSSSTVGTVDYMAPERFESADADTRSDIYSLGVICYEMLTGKVPRGSFPSLHKVNPHIPRHLSEAVMQALRPDPAARFATIEAFASAVENKTFDLRRRILIGSLGIAIIGITMGVGTWVATRPNQKTPSEAVSDPMENIPDSSLANLEWQDLLATTDTAAHAISGTWWRTNDAIESNTSISILSQDIVLPSDYDVRLAFTRLSGVHSIALFFTANGFTGTIDIDGWDAGLSGVQAIDGRDLRQGGGFHFPLENGREYLLEIEVRGSLIRISIDGEMKSIQTIGEHSLSVVSPWQWNPPVATSLLGIGSYQSPTRFHRFEWRAANRE